MRKFECPKCGSEELAGCRVVDDDTLRLKCARCKTLWEEPTSDVLKERAERKQVKEVALARRMCFKYMRPEIPRPEVKHEPPDPDPAYSGT